MQSKVVNNHGWLFSFKLYVTTVMCYKSWFLFSVYSQRAMNAAVKAYPVRTMALVQKHNCTQCACYCWWDVMKIISVEKCLVRNISYWKLDVDKNDDCIFWQKLCRRESSIISLQLCSDTQEALLGVVKAGAATCCKAVSYYTVASDESILMFHNTCSSTNALYLNVMF